MIGRVHGHHAGQDPRSRRGGAGSQENLSHKETIMHEYLPTFFSESDFQEERAEAGPTESGMHRTCA